MERCNSHCDAGKDDEFYKAPEHLRKIQTGPFYAIRLQRNFDVTMGGISINEHLQALRPDQSVIPGLYVTGDQCLQLDGRGVWSHVFLLLLGHELRLPGWRGDRRLRRPGVRPG